MDSTQPHTVELCAGAGGEALGLERAGFAHACLVESDRHACATLRQNRPGWDIREEDVRLFDGRPFRGAAMVSGGLPCPPYSVAGRQLGPLDERDLFSHGLRIVEEVRPQAVMLENVKGILGRRFEPVLGSIVGRLRKLGYTVDWRLLNSSDFGVPQLRPRVIFVALKPRAASRFVWPAACRTDGLTVGTALADLMAEEGWQGAEEWASRASGVAPTLVGGSKLHGGADLGPTRARRAWAQLGVNGSSVADRAPGIGFNGTPRLTVRMTARLQGFPDDWSFAGKKTAAYRQVANALPPPVAQAVGHQLLVAIGGNVPRRQDAGSSWRVG